MTQPFNPKVIFVNGPPRAGKDTVSKLLNDLINIHTDSRIAKLMKFTAPMDVLIAQTWSECYLSEKHTFKEIREDFKGEGVMHAGKTPRQCLIDLSENWFKPYFGPTIFGRLAAAEVDRYPDVMDRTFIFSDSGFYQEILGFVGHCQRTTTEEMVVIQVHRDGCTFDGDSRNWVDLRDVGIPLIQLNNSGTIAELEALCYNLFHDLFVKPKSVLVVEAQNASITEAGSGVNSTTGDNSALTCSGDEGPATTTHCGLDSGKGEADKNLQSN